MKTPNFTLLLITLSMAGLTFASCSKSDRDQASANVKDAYHDSKDAIVDTWHDVKSYTFEKRDDFGTEARAQMATMRAKVADLQADHADAQASASRKAALQELKNSQADYQAKIDAVGNATVDTWDSAKANVVSSWDHLKADYDKARAD